MTDLYLSRVESPLGELLIVTDEKAQVRALDFRDYELRLRRLLKLHYGSYELTDKELPKPIAEALSRYFEGDRSALDQLATATPGTKLESQVWSEIRRIPAGSTISYGALAKMLGYSDPRVAIDVGAALRANPIALIVPCHRVIAKDGSIKGYAGGVNRKRWLLEHEGAVPVHLRRPWSFP